MAFCGTSSQFGTVVFNSEKAFQKNDLCSPDICNFILTAHTDSAAGDKQMHFGNSSDSVQDCY